MKRWEPGSQIILRSMWGSKVRAVWPVTVINDQPDFIATYLRKGTTFKRATTQEGVAVRLPVGEWNLTESIWTRDVVRLAFPQKSYSLLAFLEEQDPQVAHWYVNLEESFLRHNKGYDFTDLFLDVVISGNLAEFRWKDEDELLEAIDARLISKEQADDARKVGQQVIHLARTKGSPFSDGWESWKPSPDWPIPRL